jgi:hypothetical protein
VRWHISHFGCHIVHIAGPQQFRRNALHALLLAGKNAAHAIIARRNALCGSQGRGRRWGHGYTLFNLLAAHAVAQAGQFLVGRICAASRCGARGLLASALHNLAVAGLMSLSMALRMVASNSSTRGSTVTRGFRSQYVPWPDPTALLPGAMLVEGRGDVDLGDSKAVDGCAQLRGTPGAAQCRPPMTY